MVAIVTCIVTGMRCLIVLVPRSAHNLPPPVEPRECSLQDRESVSDAGLFPKSFF
jgi:hypothetical protein